MFVERIARWGEASFSPAASEQKLAACEAALGDPLPDELRSLLCETDGISGEFGLRLLWTCEEIETENVLLRTDPEYAALYMPFDALVFFSDAGNGDYFAVAMRGSCSDVFVWNHEDDSRTWVAPGVLRFLEAWMTGELEI